MSNGESKRAPKSIGVVSDSRILQTTLGAFLIDLGYRVISVSASELRTDLGQHLDGVDLVLLPLSLGKRVISKVSQKNPQAPIVIVRDGGPALSTQDAVNLGVYTYLSQPIRFDELELLLVRLWGVP